MFRKFLIVFILFLSLFSIGFSASYSCGDTINIPGDHTIDADNTTTGTCITITSGNVNLDCQGYTLSGDGGVNDYGINVNNVDYVNISNCNLDNFGQGLRGYYTDYSRFVNLNVSNSGNGIWLERSTNDLLDNIYAFGNTNGISITSFSHYFNLKNSVTELNSAHGINLHVSYNGNFTNIESKNNANGVYDQSGDFNLYQQFNATNNSGYDFICPTGNDCTTNTFVDILSEGYTYLHATTNSFTNFVQLKKDLTNVNKPITLLDDFGLYTLGSDFTTNADAIIIAESSVALDCQGYTISGDGGVFDYGIDVLADYVNVSNCNIDNFDRGIRAYYSDYSRFVNVNVSGSGNGIWLERSTYNYLDDIYAFGNSNGIIFYSISSNFDLRNSVTESNSGNGVYLHISHNGNIRNTESKNNVNGFFDQSSDFNTYTQINVSNNSNYDFICDPGNDCASNTFYDNYFSNSSKFSTYPASNNFYKTVSGQYLGNWWSDSSVCSDPSVNISFVDSGFLYTVCDSNDYTVVSSLDRGPILAKEQVPLPFYTLDTTADNIKTSNDFLIVNVSYNGNTVTSCDLNLNNGSVVTIPDFGTHCYINLSLSSYSSEEVISYYVSYDIGSSLDLESRSFIYYSSSSSAKVFPSFGLGSLFIGLALVFLFFV